MATLSLDFLRNYRLGTYRESEPVAYQYDQGHVLDILLPGEVTSAEVQYWTRGMTEAAAYEVGSITQQTDGSYVIECNVPNEYFGTWGDLRVYLVVTDDSKYVVTYEGRIKVLQREKPEDYVDDDPDNEALRVLNEAREAAQSASADADRAAQVAASIPADYSELSGNVSDLTGEVGQLNERLDDEINDLNTELYGNPGIISNTIPTSFISSDNHCTLSLVGYAGKKAFISNKNLFPNYPPLSSNGVTLTPNADGSITLSGTSTGVAAFQLSGNVMPTVGNGTFTLSANNTVAIGDNTTYINPSINGSYGNIACRLNTVDATETFTLGENDRITAIRIRISSGVTLPDNYKLFIQLEEGEQKTEFVEHQGYIIDITQATIETNCFDGYNYVTAQVDVTGTVSYVVREGGINDQITDLDNRVEALENQPTTNYKKFIGKKIVCFGDSITGNFPAPIDYPSMIAELTGATVYNAGFGGCCMSDNGQRRKDFTMCRLVDSIVAGDFSAQWNSGVSITYAGTSTDYVPERLTMLENIDWSDIDYITIAYGTNDWNSNYGLDNSENPTDTTTYIGAFRYSIEKLLTAYPHLKVMPITPLWRWWDTKTGMPSEIHTDYIDSNDYTKGTGYKLWQYGDALVEASKMYHIPVFDLYWNCMMFKQNRFQYFNTTDGTHPKLEGRELMAELISAHMESVY